MVVVIYLLCAVSLIVLGVSVYMGWRQQLKELDRKFKKEEMKCSVRNSSVAMN